MRVFAAAAYLVGAVPVALTVLAGQGALAVVGGFLVSAYLWLQNLNFARHNVTMRLGGWLYDGLHLAAMLAVAASPVGRWVAEGWLAMPLLTAYGGAILVALSLAAWALRGRRPGSPASRVLDAVDLLLLRGGLLAVLLAGVFQPHPRLLPAAVGLAAAQLLPGLAGRIVGNYVAVWLVDIRLLTAQPPVVRWALWGQWARDALLAPRRPDDRLLRVMVALALESVAGQPKLPAQLRGITNDAAYLLALVDDGLRFLEGWMLVQGSGDKYEAIADRVTSIAAYAATAKARLAVSHGQLEEAAALQAHAAALARDRGLPNMAAIGELYESEVADALRIAEDESLSRVIRRAAMFAAASHAASAGDLATADVLYKRAEAIRPGRADRAVILAEMRRDVGYWLPSWMLRGTTRTIRLLEYNFAGWAREKLTGVPFLQNLGDTNALEHNLQLGCYAVRVGQYAPAVKILSEVADEAERRGHAFTLHGACYWLARAYGATGDPAAAYQSLRRAMASYDLYRAGLLAPGREDSLGALTLTHVYALTLLVDHPENADHPAVAAFEIAEQARARGTLEALGAAMSPPSGTDQLVDREQAAETGYAAALGALEAADGDARIARLHSVRSWRAELSRCWDEMVEAGGEAAEYAELRRATPVTYDGARRLLAGATVFEFHVTDDADMVVFVARSDLAEPVVVRIPDEHAAISRATQGIDWSGDLSGLDAVMRPFLAPVLDWSEPGDVVCFSPFGSMHAIPLHAMTVDGVPLLERNPVCYVPSLTVLRHCAAKRTARRERALVMADSRADQPLPHARIQAAEIAALFPDGAAITRLGAEATTAGLSDLLTATPSVDLLHLACHGQFEPDDPLRSGILLAPAERLTVADLMGLRMRADLVTFSACQSGMSEHELGEELTGLAQAAMYAGTPSVLVTLWSVDEIATSIVMSGFYRRLLSGAAKVSALRDAQLETRAMTGEALIVYCERAMARVAEPDRWLLCRDIADARFRCRDFAGALAGYEELAAMPDPPGGEDWMVRLRLALTRCRRALNRPAAIDYSVRPFEHPYYWAPFVLIGDWR